MAKGKRNNSIRLTRRAWAPVGHTINATGETVGEVVSTAGNIVKRGLKGAKSLGNIWTRHANQAFTNVVRGKGRRGTRRSTRRNRH